MPDPVRCFADAVEAVARRPRLPHPGGGATLQRWSAFAEVARGDLSVARLVEGHHDAVAILEELGHPVPGGFLAVWAARPESLVAEPTAGGWALDGEKPFCSGAGLVDLALVAATTAEGPRLLLVPGGAGEIDPGSWSPLGMEATASATVRFRGVDVPAEDAVGGARAYVDRPGFGHGGCGVAACWWGGARAVLGDVAAAIGADDPIARSDLGRAASRLGLARLALRDAADRIDRSPLDGALASRSALATRWAVADAARAVLATAERHRGTSSLAVDVAANDRMRDLATYLSQHRDRASIDLGRDVAEHVPVGLA